MIVRHQPATTRRPASPRPRPTLRRRAMCQFIAMALFGGGVAQAATPPAFSPAWFAAKQQQAATAPASTGGSAGNNVSFTPGSALLQQRVQQSITNLNTAASALAAQMQAQKDAQAAAAQLVSTVPNGLGDGALKPAAGIAVDPTLWQNASKPTDTVSGGKHTVQVNQTAKKAILTWDSFNVGRDTTLYFNQSAGNLSGGGNDWIALNRVNDPSANPSQILGSMKAEGTVYVLNRNGVIFGQGAQVNTRSLLASSMSLFSTDLKASNTAFLSSGIGTQGNILFTDGTGTGNQGVTVEKGASITASADGFVILAAPSVANRGSLVADDGQVILASGDILSNIALNGALTIADRSITTPGANYSVENSGLIQTRRGDIALAGPRVQQNGVVVASTSISRPGSVQITSQSDAQTGSVEFGSGSVTAVLPEKDGASTTSSAAADKAFVPGSVTVTGNRVTMDTGSLIEVPGGNVNLTAIGSPQASPPAGDGRIYIDGGATIDVSGLAGVELPMSALLVSVPRVGQNELADSPLLRNSFLYTQKNVVLDSTASGTRADRLDWIGSPILNAAGYIENMPRDISQMLTRGGSITLDGGDVITRTGSRLALDGGYLAYQSGWITTPNLMGADGRIYNIASADPDVNYVGFAGQFTSTHARWGVSETYNSPLLGGATRYQEGFVKGADAGTLTLHASNAVALDGDISAEATPGTLQAGDGTQPDNGSFLFSMVGPVTGNQVTQPGLRIQQTSQTIESLLPGFDKDTAWSDVDVANGSDTPWMVIGADTLGKAGFASLDFSTLFQASPGTQRAPLEVAEGTQLSVRPGGSITLDGSMIDVYGTLTAPAGSISLYANPSVAGGGITLHGDATLSARGEWVNDTAHGPEQLQGSRWTNGGTITLLAGTAFNVDGSLADLSGSILLDPGSQIDVSGGGYVDVHGNVLLDGGVPAGRGGNVTLETYADDPHVTPNFGTQAPPVLDSGYLSLGGSIRGWGFSGGGTLSLGAAEIQVGGDPDDMALSTGLWLSPSFFEGQGFARYTLNAATDAVIADGARVVVGQANMQGNLDALRMLPSGADLYTSTAVTSIGASTAWDRWSSRPTDAAQTPGLFISAGEYHNGWATSSPLLDYQGVDGSVRVGQGASIAVAAGDTISLSSYQDVMVDGALVAPGGTITLETDTPRVSSGRTGRVWLGSGAQLDASGTTLVNPYAAVAVGNTGGVLPRTGEVLDGGDVNLVANGGFIVTDEGSLIDVSGAADSFDLVQGTRRLNGVTTEVVPTSVWSDAGNILLSAAAGLYVDGTLQAHGGAGLAEGGSLQVTAVDDVTRPSTHPSMLMVTSSTLDKPTFASSPDGDGADATGTLWFATDVLNGSGITTLQLGPTPGPAVGTQVAIPVAFAGNVDLAVGKQVLINASAIQALPAADDAAGPANVTITAPYVQMSGMAGDNLAVSGNGSLTVNATAIDMGGMINLQGWKQARFNASGDLRFSLPAYVANTSTSTPVPGMLFSTGDLTFDGGQVYPESGYHFAINANASGAVDADGNARETTVTFLAPGQAAATPMSAGGALLVTADHIEQEGVLRVPSGTLVLGSSDGAADAASFGFDASALPLAVTKSVHLAPGSITSVSLDDLTVPYGTTIDGVDWRYNVYPNANAPTMTAPPSKQLQVHGDIVALDSGATIDLSGGGHLQASEFVPGTGGTRDLLATAPNGATVYAIIPGFNGPLSAQDMAMDATGVAQPDVGRQVYLSGVPGLANGYYTLLPSQYATVPNALRIYQATTAADGVTGRVGTQTDGSYTVVGYYGNALSGAHDARTSTFVVQTAPTWQQYSQYRLTDAGTFFSAAAAKKGNVVPPLPADAARLLISAGQRLDLGTALTAQPGEGGRTSQVDIAGEAIQVLGADQVAMDGYLGISADGLTALGAGSLLLGGTRSSDTDGDHVNVTANTVLLSNDASHPLAGQEILLVAGTGGDGVVLEDGSVLAARGDGNPVASQPLVFGRDAGLDANGGTLAAIDGGGALLRVSQHGAAGITRLGLADGAAGGNLTIGAGAQVTGGNALTLDATGTVRVDDSATLSGKAVDATANHISFVAPGAAGPDDGLAIGAATLAQWGVSDSVILRSRGAIDFTGPVDATFDHALLLSGGSLTGDGSDVAIHAGTLTLANQLGAAAGDALAGGGTLRVAADELDFGAGTTTLRGFGAFEGTASAGMAATGSGGVDFGAASVDLTAPIFLTHGGGATTLATTGAMHLHGSDGTALSTSDVGGALTLRAASIDDGMDLQAGAGALSLDATAGSITIAPGARLDVSGVTKTFFDTKAYASGGTLKLDATGDIAISDGAEVRYGGATQGDAGSFHAVAGGNLLLGGTYDGHAANGYRGGYFTVGTGGALNLDALTALAASSGSTGLVDITSGQGDLALSAAQTLKAGKVYLSANGGKAVIDGTIDASAVSGSHIEVYAAQGVDINGTLDAHSTLAEQRGGDVILGTSGTPTDNQYASDGHELVQRQNAGYIHIGANARINVSGGADTAFAGGRVSMRAPVLDDGDVPITVDSAGSIVGARDVTIEPYATWSTKDATTGAQHFDGVIDPAGWYQNGGASMVAGTWTDARGNVLAAPADADQLASYLSQYYFTPDAENTDHAGFYGYVDGDPTKGPGSLMSFVQAPGFTFGDRFAGIRNVNIRPGIELKSPADGSAAGDINVLTNWNLAAGVIDSDNRVHLAYRYMGEAPILTVRAANNLNLDASITDGFYQTNDGAQLNDPPADTSPTDPTDPTNPDNPAYDTALAAYQKSQDYLDTNGLWNGTINLRDGTTTSISADPYYQPLQAPAQQQTDAYYANYQQYIAEVGDADAGGWAVSFNRSNNQLRFLPYNPTALVAPQPGDYGSYADYATDYETWLEANFNRAATGDTPSPLLLPVDPDYLTWSQDYSTYISGHSTYYTYVRNNVGNSFTGSQLYYAPFAPKNDPANSNDNPAYDAALAAYQKSQSYLDTNGLWNGTINLRDGTTTSISADPYYQPLQAPAQEQTDAYYANYQQYIAEVGDADAGGWAVSFNRSNNQLRFLPYNPTALVAPQPGDYSSYADYATDYETWLEANFNRAATGDTPSPLLLPVDPDYLTWSQDYSTYISGHSTYYTYVRNNVGNSFTGSQLYYAPFAPKNDPVNSNDNPAYDAALAAYQKSQDYLDANGLWNGTINLRDGTTTSISADPYYQPLQAPSREQTDAYYANYQQYIAEVGDADAGGWAVSFNRSNNQLRFLPYNPTALVAPQPGDYGSYADYATDYETWLEANFNRAATGDTPSPLLLPVDPDYLTWSQDYSTYISGHSTYYTYVRNNVGNSFTGSQLYYAPFAPKNDPANSNDNPAYDAALAAYQKSQSYLDANGLWNGTINLRSGETADISKDPYYQALQAPQQEQTDAYYANYQQYIAEVGDADAGGWAVSFNRSNNQLRFLPYNPTALVAPQPGDYGSYADYANEYETWLETNFNRALTGDTPSPLLLPVDPDYALWSQDYSTYISGHSTYYTYVRNNVGNSFTGSQLYYAPFAPKDDPNDSTPPVTTVPVGKPAADNSPSNMPTLGNAVSLASATLMGGSSTSYRFVAGADVDAVNPLATQAGATGGISIDGHFAVKDTVTDPLVVTPNSYAGKTLLFPTTIRTGTGDIDMVSAGDIQWLDSASPAVVYSAGAPADGTTAGTDVSVLRPSEVAPGDTDTLPDMLVNDLVNPDNAGDVNLRAGGDIDGIQTVVDADRSQTKDVAGTSVAQYWWQWMQVGNAADGSRSSIDFANFHQGVMSNGGNVNVDAGGDISQLSVSLPTTWYLNSDGASLTTVGGGNLAVRAGGDILSGTYFVARGTADIQANGAIAASAGVTTTSSGTTSPVSTLLAMQDAQVRVVANQGVDLGGVYDPSYLTSSNLVKIFPAGAADRQGYSTTSSLDVSSLAGDVVLGSLLDQSALIGGNGSSMGDVLPATVGLSAFTGDVNIRTTGELSPSPTGNLTLLAGNDINLSQSALVNNTFAGLGLIDVDPEDIASPLNTKPSSGLLFFSPNAAANAAYHTPGLLHADDTTPIRVYALGGDINDGVFGADGFTYNNLVLYPAKQAYIRAGRDIVNLALQGQQTRRADMTLVSAGRDIYDTPYTTNSAFNPSQPNSYRLVPSLVLGGPGTFVIEAGRNVGPFVSEVDVSSDDSTNSKSATGIQAVGNAYNPYLPHESADVLVNFGIGPGVDTQAFLARYLAGDDGLASLMPDLVAYMQRRVAGQATATGLASDDVLPPMTEDEARALFAQQPETVQRMFAETELFKLLAQVGTDYNDASSPYANQYARGYDALATLFPSSLGYTANGTGQGGLNGAAETVDTGDLDIRSSTIQTQQGGDVTLVGPGGQALIGSTSAPSVITDGNGTVKAGPNTMGLLTLEAGNVNVFTDRSLLLAQSRVFTERGGDVTIWSSNGDINAGQGAKTVSEVPPPTFLCDIDAYCIVDARGQVSGAGIATLQTVEGAEPGNAYLVAPRGTVDAGDAGIRVSGNLVIAAARVANADNIQVKGESIGIPVTAAVNVGALNAASAAATAASQAAEDVVRKQQSDARDKMPSEISVHVLHDGDNTSSVSPHGAYDYASPVQVLDSGAANGRLTEAERKALHGM